MSRIYLLKEPRRQVYLQRVGLVLPPPTLINQCTRLCDVPGTQNVGLPIQYRFNVGPASQPIAGSVPVNRIRRWPNIETELGDCPVFALTAIRVTLYAPKGHHPDTTIHFNHEYNREYIFFEDFSNTKVLNLRSSNVILHMFIRTGVQKCQAFPTHITLLSPK